MSAPHIFLVAGEASGDALGASLMRALRNAHRDAAFSGVGGKAMTQEGLVSFFPMTDIAVMGLAPVIARLPTLLARIEETACAALAARPDCVVIIDAPDFTHRVARKVRRIRPDLPIIDYVSPTVWAWRPGRAKKMRAYVDCVLALLPFEPEAHAQLGGPRCVYVGHPLVEHLDELAPCARPEENPLLLVLPGSRLAEIERMTSLYGETLALLLRDHPKLDVAIPVAPHMEAPLRRALQGWPVAPRLLSQAEKFGAFRRARAALVTSGVATLELALADTPMTVAYKVSRFEAWLRFLVDVHSIVLPNLVIGENAVPEFLQEQATPQALAAALAPLLFADGPARAAQRAAFSRVRARLVAAGRNPSARAAEIVLDYARHGRV